VIIQFVLCNVDVDEIDDLQAGGDDDDDEPPPPGGRVRGGGHLSSRRRSKKPLQIASAPESDGDVVVDDDDRRPVFRAVNWPSSDDRVPTLLDVSICLDVARGLPRSDAEAYLLSEGIDLERAEAYVDVVDRLERSMREGYYYFCYNHDGYFAEINRSSPELGAIKGDAVWKALEIIYRSAAGAAARVALSVAVIMAHLAFASALVSIEDGHDDII
jgi:hypothetical protein